MPNKAPENWEEKTLGDILDKGSSNLSANKLNNCDGIYPVYGAGGLVKKINFYQQEQEYLAIIKDGAGVGRVYHYKPKTSILGTLQYLFPKKNVNIRFAYYYLQSIDFKKYYQGAAIPHIYYKDYKSEQLIVPPLSEQERIVRILDEVFENIEKAKQNTLKNLNNAKELFEQMQNKIFNDSYEKKELGEICTLYQGLAINAKTKHLLCEKSSLPLLRIKDLKENSESQYIKETGYPENALVCEQDIIYTRTGSLGLVFKGRHGILHNNSFKVVPNDTINREFLFEWLQNPVFKHAIIHLAERAAQPDITHALFKQQEINIPPIEIQIKKVQKIKTIRKQISNLEQTYNQKLKSLEELKQSILQKAFNGEL